VPQYLIIRNLGLYDTMWALIIPGCFSPFNMFLVRNFINGIPYSLAESATIDGAGILTICRKIYFPICQPVIATITLFYGIGYWNSYYNSLMFTDSRSLQTLQMILYRLQSNVQMMQQMAAGVVRNPPAEGIKMATAVVTIGPIVLLYPFLKILHQGHSGRRGKGLIKYIVLGGLSRPLKDKITSKGELNMMKKLVALLLVCMLLPVSMLTALAAEDVYTVRWVMPGNEPDEMAKVEDALNKKMEAEGKNFRVDIVRIPWDAWEQRSNLMINTKEDFGLLHIMSDQASVMGKNVLVDLKTMVENYPDLKAKFTDAQWAECTNTKGEVVAVPAAWQVFQPLGELSIRTDVLAAVGKELPQTPDEVLEAAIAMKEYVEDQVGIKTYYWTQSTNYPAEWLERTYDTYPFYVDRVSNLWKVDQEGNVTS